MNEVESKITRNGEMGGAEGPNDEKWRAMSDLTVTQSTEARLSGLARLQVKAKTDSSLRFNNLLHHITPVLLTKAYQNLNRQSAKGIDEESWEDFGERLPERIQQLHRRMAHLLYDSTHIGQG